MFAYSTFIKSFSSCTYYVPPFIISQKYFVPTILPSVASTRMLLKARPLRQRYMRKHTCRKRQESFLNAYTAYFQLSYLLYADNPLAYIHTTTSHTISETAHTVCRKGLSATLQRQACTDCGYWQREAAYAVFMSPTNHKQCIEKLAGSSAVSHPPFSLLYSSSSFFFLL